jgi:hypothetical protein
MKVSELVAALTAELIRGNDAEIGFMVPLTVKSTYDENVGSYAWLVNDMRFATSNFTAGLKVNLHVSNAEFRHSTNEKMEIILT